MPAMYDLEAFEISTDEPHVLDVAARRPPRGWQPQADAALDDALPFPWPEKYLVTFRQPFNPHGFFTNAAALAGEFLRTGDPVVRKIAGDLHRRMREYTAMQGNARFLVYTFPKGYRGMKVQPPWTSAYASGAALIGLTLLADSGAVPEAADDAREVLIGLGRPITPPASSTDLWVSFVDRDRCLWFEEMPLAQAEQPRILNGHIRALTGLYVYWVRTREPAALELLRAGVLTVKRHALEYRRPGRVNAYDLLEPAIDDYGPERTIAQQDFLYRLTGMSAFAEYRDLFEADVAASRSTPPD